ncbi:hypothetical protein ACFLZV_03280, partial [Candidatus Margulisiibacteriota bacterium]
SKLEVLVKDERRIIGKEKLKSFLLNKKQDIEKRLKSINPKTVSDLFKICGFKQDSKGRFFKDRGEYMEFLNSILKKVSENGRKCYTSHNTSERSWLFDRKDLEEFNSWFFQFTNLIDHLSKPSKILEAMDKVVPVMPSYKSMFLCTWLESTARGMQRIFKELKRINPELKIDPKDFPIIVMDQLPEKGFKENAEFIAELEKKTGIKILHFSSEQIYQLADKVGFFLVHF